MGSQLKQKAIWYRRLSAVSAIALLISFATPGVASAHVLKLDGSIAGILHINPDDDTPVAGKSTDYIIEFDDDANQFTLPQCDCTVSVVNTNDNKTIATEPLVVTSSKISENHYTFSDSGIYNLRFTGAPKQANGFQPFTLTYTVTVASQSSSQSVSPFLWIGMGTVITLVIAAGYATNRHGRLPVRN
jgi:hypothetical protein